MCARLEGDSSLVEEFELPLWLAASRDIWRGTTLKMTVQFTVAYFGLLSLVVVVLCYVVCVVCVVVVFASACDVQLLSS